MEVCLKCEKKVPTERMFAHNLQCKSPPTSIIISDLQSKCEYCQLDYPNEILQEHISVCDAKLQLDAIAREENPQPEQVKHSQNANKSKLNIPDKEIIYTVNDKFDDSYLFTTQIQNFGIVPKKKIEIDYQTNQKQIQSQELNKPQQSHQMQYQQPQKQTQQFPQDSQFQKSSMQQQLCQYQFQQPQLKKQQDQQQQQQQEQYQQQQQEQEQEQQQQQQFQNFEQQYLAQQQQQLQKNIQQNEEYLQSKEEIIFLLQLDKLLLLEKMEQQQQNNHQIYQQFQQQQNSNTLLNQLPLIIEQPAIQPNTNLHQNEQIQIQNNWETFKFKRYTFLDENHLNCVICMLDYNENDRIILLKCTHRYHEKCLLDWVKKKNLCPICNIEMQ